MVTRQAQGVGALAHRGVHLFKVADPLLAKAIAHHEEDARQHLRVVVGAVMVEVAEFVVFGDDIEFVLFQFGVDVARERDGVKIGVRERDPLSLRHHPEKAGIEVGVVGDQHAVAGEIEERAQRLGGGRGALHHLVGDPGKFRDLGRDRDAGIDEGVEAVEHFPVADQDGADLGDPAGTVVKTGGLDIEDHHLVGKRRERGPVDGALGVVDVVTFDPARSVSLT